MMSDFPFILMNKYVFYLTYSGSWIDSSKAPKEPTPGTMNCKVKT